MHQAFTFCKESLRRASESSADAWRWNYFRSERYPESCDAFGSGPCAFRRTPKMARLEAALLVANGAISTRKLTNVAMLADTTEVLTLIDQLNVAYDQSRSAFRIERVATGFQMLTRPKFAPWLDRLHNRQTHLKLSAPAMETLAIVAYRQPITRADIEAIRGVASTEMLKQLMERNLVRIAGEDNSLGRPYLYGTTRHFLEHFGLRNTSDLPLADQLRPTPPAVENSQAGNLDDESEDSALSDAA
ncbi:MAG: SMC-Scp complex subunit ScpB [Planctomycetaceae bacterium]|nr:SMC-Scp complex subunit ScpB [Planctomycetaceae bacterium]